MAEKRGIVYLVGAGPGDPGLLTLKGKERLEQAQVLVYDRLASERLVLLAPPSCERIYVGKEPGRRAARQEEINELLVSRAQDGKTVVRLKGGDPFVFGRGGEEILALEEAGIPYEVVPGVTSAVAALADAGIPVTHRKVSRSFHVITGHTAEDDAEEAVRPAETAAGETTDMSRRPKPSADEAQYREYARLDGTLIFLMGLSRLEEIVGALLKYGKAPDTPAAVVTDGTLPGMRCVRAVLSALPEAVRRAGLHAPGIIVVGPTAAYAMTCRSRGPLGGAVIGITGTDRLYEKLARGLCALGAECIRAGAARVIRENREGLAAAVRRLAEFDWVVFTSRNGAELFFETLREEQTDLRVLGKLKFAVVGPGTGQYLREHGIHADFMPGKERAGSPEASGGCQGMETGLRPQADGNGESKYTTESLARGLAGRVRAGSRILIPRARQGSRALTEILEAAGAICEELPVYDIVTTAGDLRALARANYVTFGSGSGVRGFFAAHGEVGRDLFLSRGGHIRPVCIGRVTEQALAACGVTGALTAETCTADGILEVIPADWQQKNRASE